MTATSEDVQELVIKNFQAILPELVTLLVDIGSDESETVSTIYQARSLRARFYSLLTAIRGLPETQLNMDQQIEMYKDLKHLLDQLTHTLISYQNLPIFEDIAES